MLEASKILIVRCLFHEFASVRYLLLSLNNFTVSLKKTRRSSFLKGCHLNKVVYFQRACQVLTDSNEYLNE